MNRPGRPSARSLRWLGLASALGLGVFHADLLRQRLADATLGEPGVALRWLITALLLLGFATLARRGVSLVRDRRALVLWLVALLLHFGATPAVVLGPVWLALPAVAALSFAGAELWARATAGRVLVPTLAFAAPRGCHPLAAAPRGPRRHLPTFLPRPPPARG